MLEYLIDYELRNFLVSSVCVTILLLQLVLPASTCSPTKELFIKVYIRGDGSIETEPQAQVPLLRNGNTYILTGDLSGSLIVERDNLVLDGRGYRLYKPESVTEDYNGIEVRGRVNVTVKNFVIEGYAYGIYSERSSRVFLVENVVANCYRGISILKSSNHRIERSTLRNCREAIRFGSSGDSAVLGNIIRENKYGLFISLSHTSLVEGNVVQNNSGGIYISGTGIRVIENVIRDNSEFGVELSNSINTTILGNVFVNDGLRVLESYGTVASGNTVNGKPLRFYEKVSNLTISGEAGQVVLVNCTKVVIENLTLGNVETAIWLWATDNAIIRGNVIEANSWYGISLLHCFNCSLLGNVIRGNKVGGVELSHSHGNTIENNTVKNNGKKGGLTLSFSTDTTIKRNIIENNEVGVSFDTSDGNIVSSNTFQRNNVSLFFYNSTRNLIVGNKIQFNSVSVTVYDSSRNTFYFNDFIDNRNQVLAINSSNAWDNGSKGNFWSDHDCTDENGDGVCENPYIINQENVDRFPLGKSLQPESGPGSDSTPPPREEQPWGALNGILTLAPLLLVALLIIALILLAALLLRRKGNASR
ncbi:MAG: NosD domain-containing protein [Thermofilaceae archaeon]|nr:NosD domain-containing protein [Thermofilaceae archaeon]